MHHGEKFNTISHLIGTALAFCGSILLLFLAARKGDPVRLISFTIYGVTTVSLYLISTLYHASKGEKKKLLRTLDYTSIYLKIAGNYTPFMLITLKGFHAISVLTLVWALAGLGVAQELLIGRKTKRWSFTIYGIMSVASIVVINDLAQALPMGGFLLIMLGYLCYAIGCYFFFNDEKITHGHGIWHLFVVAGAFSQYVCLLMYVA